MLDFLHCTIVYLTILNSLTDWNISSDIIVDCIAVHYIIVYFAVLYSTMLYCSILYISCD